MVALFVASDYGPEVLCKGSANNEKSKSNGKKRVKLTAHLCAVVVVVLSIVDADLQDHLVGEGMAWVDDQGDSGRSFWFPSLVPEMLGDT